MHTRAKRRISHRRLVWPPSVDGMLPESWLLYKFKALQETRTATTSACHPRNQYDRMRSIGKRVAETPAKTRVRVTLRRSSCIPANYDPRENHPTTHRSHDRVSLTHAYGYRDRSTHERRVRLSSVDGIMPEIWLLLKSNAL
jgi:hypothetical protein